MLASGEQPDAAPDVQPPVDSPAPDEVAGQRDVAPGSMAADSAASSQQAAGAAGQTVTDNLVHDSSEQTGTHDHTEL